MEKLVVFVCKNTAFCMQLFLNDKALKSVKGYHLATTKPAATMHVPYFWLKLFSNTLYDKCLSRSYFVSISRALY